MYVPFISATDFHLQSAVAGATLSDVPLDFDGCVRPQNGAQDIGALER